jgi:hypothetical protein
MTVIHDALLVAVHAQLAVVNTATGGAAASLGAHRRARGAIAQAHVAPA